MPNIALLVVPLLLLPACACLPAPGAQGAQDKAFAAALGRMCDVDRQAGLLGDADPLGLGAKRTAWITEHVDHPDIIELRVLLSVKDAPEQARMLRDRVKDAGLPGCALADDLARSGEGGLSP